MTWREMFSDNEGVGTCRVCAEHKLLMANRDDFHECHDCWMSRFVCLDCGVNTRQLDEYYAVHNKVWLTANPQNCGMLCIGCIEQRLGRTLTKEDFNMDALINLLELTYEYPKSERLIDRLSRSNTLTIII